MAEQIAVGLQKMGVARKQTVALMLTGADYFYCFFGVLLAGAIPVPIYPPARASQLKDHLRRHCSILSNCQAVCLIAYDEAASVAKFLVNQVDSIRAIPTPGELRREHVELTPIVADANDIALLQYTSGSTGLPKGVTLTHANLLANIRAMGEAVEATSSDIFVSWLPLYHDMGLIGAWLGSLYFAMPLINMTPLSFLARPSRWLSAITQYRGTFTAAPNFAYELCLKRVKGNTLQALDLSSLRGMFNGAEPISAETMSQFNQHFKVAHLAAKAMKPVYGLAESSVGLAFPDLSREPIVDSIDREIFVEDRASRSRC